MQQDVELTVEGESVLLRCPPHDGLGQFLAGMGAKWDHTRGVFIAPVSMEPHMRALAWSWFATDGTASLATVTVDASQYATQSSIAVAGRQLLTRRQHSRMPVLGAGVYKVSGDWTFEGVGETFRPPLLGVNTAILQAVIPLSIALQGAPGLQIVQTVGRREALQTECAALTARLEVVAKELAA